MVSRSVTVSGAGDETASKLCTRDPARIVLVIRNTSTTKTMMISDTVGISGAFMLEPEGMLALLASDGYDTTQEYRAYCTDLGSATAVVMEQFRSGAGEVVYKPAEAEQIVKPERATGWV